MIQVNVEELTLALKNYREKEKHFCVSKSWADCANPPYF